MVVGGPSINPEGRGSVRGAERRLEEELAEARRENEELRAKLADRGLKEENKVLKARVKDLEAEVERLGREGGGVSRHPQEPDLGSERVGFDVAELVRAGVAGEGMPALVMALANRVADQSELLSRRAERC